MAASPSATAPEVAAAIAARKAEHDRAIQEHRMEVRERAKAKRAEHERRHAEALQRHTLREAMRSPDPNRPPVEQLSRPSGPAVIHAPAAGSSH